MEDFLTPAKLVLMDGGSAMTAGGEDILPMAAIALILVFLRLRMVNKKSTSSFKSSRAGSAARDHHASGRLLERRRLPALKSCPNCAEELPLSALLCESCDYNFLAERPGRGQRLLPAPDEMSEPTNRIREALT
jgi:hypothetical protein